MAKVLCSFCDATLSAKEVAEGWCDSCGKKLPRALISPPSSSPQPPAPAQEPSQSGLNTFARRMERISLRALLIVIVAGAVAWLLFNLLPDDISRKERVSSVREIFWIGEEVLFVALVICVLAAKGLKVLTSREEE